jgi:hypothetical protein
LIVVVIIGILAAIAIPKFANTKDKASRSGPHVIKLGGLSLTQLLCYDLRFAEFFREVAASSRLPLIDRFSPRVSDCGARSRQPPHKLFVDSRLQDDLPVVGALAQDVASAIYLRQQFSVLRREPDLRDLGPFLRPGQERAPKWFQSAFRD